MAIQSSIYVNDGTTRTYPSTKHIATKQHFAILAKRVLDGVWETLNTSDYSLVNNSAVLTTALLVSQYDTIEVRVADTQNEITTSPADISIVSSSIANVNTVAGNISNVNIVAGNSTNVTTVASNSSNINTVASNIAHVNTVALDTLSINAVAADLVNIDNASANASTATAQAGIATAQAVISTTQAGIATTQAGLANVARIAAELALDSFDDRYLGTKTVAPTLDNDGMALLSGALYYNSVTEAMYVYDLLATTWISLKFNPADHTTLTNIGTLSHTQIETSLNAKANIDVTTGAVYLGKGTTLERPTLLSTARAMWYNTDLSKFEGWNGTQWVGVGGGATGGGADTVFVETSYTITTDYTLTTGKSATTVGNASGNVTINDGITVTIPDSSSWVILGA